MCLACTPEPLPNIVAATGTQFTVDAGADYLIADAQGTLHRLPLTGGTAARLTTAADDIRRPRISPDGQWLVYQTFSRGVWDIGIARSDGRDRRLLTSNAHDDRDPEWAADGRSIWFASDRAGNYDIWTVDVATGTETQVTQEPADDYAPSLSAGRLAFISERSGAPLLYVAALNDEVADGSNPFFSVSAPAGKLYAPRLSPNGEQLAYVRAVQRNAFPGMAVNQLVVTGIASGETRVLSADGADVFATAPSWLDDDTLLYTADGQIQRVNVRAGVTAQIPFTISLPIQASEFVQQTPIAFAQQGGPVLGLVDPAALPNDAVLVNALGDLWLLGIEGTPLQLTDDVFVERDINLSSDGKWLALISDRSGDMCIWVLRVNAVPGSSLADMNTDWFAATDDAPELAPRSCASRGPRYPTFSPDGKSLAYLEVGPRGTKDFTLRVLDLESGKTRRLRSSPQVWPGRLSWSADGSHITVAELAIPSDRFGDGANRLVRVNVEADTAAVEPLPAGFVPDFGPVAARDGSQLALIIDGALWRVAVTADGRLNGEPLLVLDELVESPAWTWDNRAIAALTNRGLEIIDIETGKRVVRNPSLDWTPAVTSGIRIVHAGRLFDGSSDTYLEDVDIVIDGARILAVEPHRPRRPGDDSDARNKVTEFIDAGNQTVIPGLIDHHVHFEPHQGAWLGSALLGFGVTTVVEPGGLPYESREHMEAWASGRRNGPRLVFSGPQLDGSRKHFQFASHINSDRRLQWEMDRAERLGYGLIKTYTRMPPARQQLAVELAHARGLPVTAHAAYRNLGFGGDRIEHLRGSSRLAYSPKTSDLYKTYGDVEEIIVQSGGSIVPTLVVAGGFFDFAWRHPDVFEDPWLQRFWSPQYRQGLAGFTRVVEKNRPVVEAGLANARATVMRLHERGVPIIAGTDAPIFPYGLSLIVELANYVDAGLTPAEALKTATANAAAELGAAGEVGRIQPGLLADLVFVDGDPLADITDLAKVSGVMINGRHFTRDDLQIDGAGTH